MVASGVRLVLKSGKEIERILYTGSGFVISPEGHVLTNAHVVRSVYRGTKVSDPRDWLGRILADIESQEKHETASVELIEQYVSLIRTYVDAVEPRVWLMFASDQVDARTLFVEENENRPDLAILKCNRRCQRFFRLLREHSDSTTGANVWPLGFPALASAPLNSVETVQKYLQQQNAIKAAELFRPDEFEYTTTKGVFSRLRKLSVANGRGENTLIEHDGRIKPGSSGGPLLDDQGRAIGINTMTTGGLGQEGYSYALSVPHLSEIVRRHVPQAIWE